MKKLCITVMVILTISLLNFTVNAEDYQNYQEIVFDNDEAYLLKDFSSSDYKNSYKKIKRKFMGWNIFVINEDEEVEFISETKLKIYNNGFTAINHDIEFDSKEETKLQLSATGGIKIGLDGNIKKFKGSIDADIKATVSYSTLTTNHEKYTFEVIVDPLTEVSIHTRGKGYINNGVGKSYFFWIQTNKGGWETFTPTTEYYEIIKDRI